MTDFARRLALILLAAAVAAGCSKKKEAAAEDGDSDRGRSSASSESDSDGMPSSKELDEAAANLKKAVPFVGKEVGNAVQAMSKVMAQSENTTVTPVDFRVLRDLLPETAGALKRKSREGQKQMGISEATAEYGDDEGAATVNLKITDSGQMRAMLAGGAAMALGLDMDKETEDGYERNIDFMGYRMHEEKNGDNVEMSTLVGGRFMIELRGYNVKPEQLKAVMETLPLKKLEGMKDEGVEKTQPAK
jgi:hypothetical protein